MSVRPHRVFVPIFVLFLFAACASIPTNDCSNGKGTKDRAKPVVCVDDTTERLTVDPESIEVWDVDPDDKIKPVKIHWVTRSGGGDLSIAMKEGQQGCVDPPEKAGRGRAHTNTKKAKEDKSVCAYTVTVDGRVLDPEVVIVRCCSDQ